MKGSDLLLRCLENEGVQWIFGVPGEETLDVLELAREFADPIHCCTARARRGLHGRCPWAADRKGRGLSFHLGARCNQFAHRRGRRVSGSRSAGRDHGTSLAGSDAQRIASVHRRLVHVQTGYEMERRNLSPSDHCRDGAQSVQGRADRKARLDPSGVAGGHCGGNGE